MSAATATKKAMPASVVPKREPAQVRRETGQWLASDVRRPEPGMRYLWVAAASGHPQSYVYYGEQGWKVVPKSKAELIQMEHFVDPITGLEGGSNSANCIFKGDSLLMEIDEAGFQAWVERKTSRFREIEEKTREEQGLEAS